ncbi:MAG TPA: S9 family peptidase [Acidimicrobiales bacterium]
MTTVASYGSWRSPISSSRLVQNAVRLSAVTVDRDDVWWNEGRPTEAGRQVVVRRRPYGSPEDAIPIGMSARSTVHEYGGSSFAVHDHRAVFSNFADQRLYLDDGTALTAEDGGRFADHSTTPDGRRVLCVRERHGVRGASEAVNDIVAVDLASGLTTVMAEGHDFFAAPRVNRAGTRIAWLAWDHPNMPWDGTELFVGSLGADMTVSSVAVVAGGAAESVSQPRWSPGGVLHWATDRSGWWRLEREDGISIAATEGCEYSGADWVFGRSSYVFLDDDTIVATRWRLGSNDLVVIRGDDESVLPTPYTSFESLAAHGRGVVAIAASASRAPAVVRIDAGTAAVEVIRESQPDVLDAASVSEPEAIEFPTTGERTAHALYYRPRNPDFAGPDDERPPLVVLSHGGPTSAASSALNLGIQFFTTRGIAVVDVNYGGSTGYGREYRDRLRGNWGIVDVDDCVHAARYLADKGEVDERRLVIRGGSAGGYTTLAALTFRPGTFAAGSSHYGVADAEALARDTHKFESRYLDGLIGPYPAAADVYRERSPIHHTDALGCPLILFQGMDDKVVPPEQSQMMAEALADKGIPHAYVAFEGEAHGFRQASTITRVADAELYFLGRVLGFTPADEVEPVRIVHEEKL